LATANREYESMCERDEAIIPTSGKNPEELVVCWVQLMVSAELGVQNILNAHGCLPPFWSQQVARQINDLRNINDGNRAEKARYLYWCYPDFRPLKALVWLSLESRRISGEIGRFLKKHKAGIKLIEFDEKAWQPKNPAELYAPFNITLSGQPFKPENPADSPDYGQICFEGVVKFYNRRHKTIEPPPLDQIQLTTSLRPEWGFPNSSHSGWEMHTIAVGKRVVCDLYGDTLSLFKGGQDRVLSAARDSRNNEHRKAKSRESIWMGQEDFPNHRSDGPGSWRAEWDFSEGVAQSRANNIAQEIHPAGIANPEEYMQMAEAERERQHESEAAYKFVERRPKARAFLNELQKGATVTKAAQLAGITRENGHRILKQIKIHLSEKKSEK
jgi:hypothetical protein